ncbi:zymogen granule protein 16 homolog B [Otolemur garnettii]|uniref:zymogen granule protein 16 homolog B n=1 Tax=Otolemur garnettii TaxID=30611 RepID=UPI000C7F625F|nr:zymogen granule protein 16 homolog B [Otolemur garnettii]
MLLLVTLALLGSRLCWAQKMFGVGKGRDFSTPEDTEHEITGLRVSVDDHMLKSVQVKFGTYWDSQRGASGGITQELSLWPGEHINEIHGSFKAFLQYLLVCTDRERCVSFGESVGKQFSAFPPKEGQVLTGIFGRYVGGGLRGIGFTWDFPLEEATNAKPTNTTSSTNSNSGQKGDKS